MRINCIAVDDEPLAIEKLKAFIGKLPQLQLVATFGRASAAIEYLRNNPVQLLFLDIQMDGITGIEMVEQMIEKPQVIFHNRLQRICPESFRTFGYRLPAETIHFRPF